MIEKEHYDRIVNAPLKLNLLDHFEEEKVAAGLELIQVVVQPVPYYLYFLQLAKDDNTVGQAFEIDAEEIDEAVHGNLGVNFDVDLDEEAGEGLGVDPDVDSDVGPDVVPDVVPGANLDEILDVGPDESLDEDPGVVPDANLDEILDETGEEVDDGAIADATEVLASEAVVDEVLMA